MQNAGRADAALELIVINACRTGQGDMEGEHGYGKKL